jgi:transcriptional regulator with XRE-family HTH domain
MPSKKAKAAPAEPPTGHADLIERALAVSGLSADELAGRLGLSPATVQRIRKGYQPARAATVTGLKRLIASERTDASGEAVDLIKLRTFVAYLSENRDLLPKLLRLLEGLK